MTLAEWAIVGKALCGEIPAEIRMTEEQERAVLNGIQLSNIPVLTAFKLEVSPDRPKIISVKFHPPATIVWWDDNTKTVVKCQPNDTYDEEKGLMAAMLKKMYGGDNTFNKAMKKWLSH